jgi:hypothetical protein
MPSDWLPAATLAVGIVGTLGGQGLSAWFTSRRDRDTRDAERAVARDAFQRETLIDLQDAIGAAVRVYIELFIHRREGFDATQRFARDQPPEDLSQRVDGASLAVERLKSRVLDDELRGLVTEMENFWSGARSRNVSPLDDDKNSFVRSYQAMGKALDTQSAVEERLGVVLRRLL